MNHSTTTTTTMMTRRLVAAMAMATTAAGTALLMPATGHAQSAGALLVRLGGTEIKPHVKSGDLGAPSLVGTQADIRSDTQLSGGVAYMLTDHVAIDVPLALPFKHDIVGAGAVSGVGKLGDVRSLPITVLGEYKFLDPQSMFRPSLGAGLTYAKFYEAKSTAVLSALTGGSPSTPTTLSIKSKLAFTVNAGVSVAFDPHWFVDAAVAHSFLKTRTTLSTGQTLDTRLDPNAFALTVGYLF